MYTRSINWRTIGFSPKNGGGESFRLKKKISLPVMKCEALFYSRFTQEKHTCRPTQLPILGGRISKSNCTLDLKIFDLSAKNVVPFLDSCSYFCLVWSDVRFKAFNFRLFCKLFIFWQELVDFMGIVKLSWGWSKPQFGGFWWGFISGYLSHSLARAHSLARVRCCKHSWKRQVIF